MDRSRFSGDKMYRIFFYAVCGIAVAVVVVVLVGLVVESLWNATVAAVSGIGPVTFWQAVGLFVLAKLFFGFGGGGSSRTRRRRRSGRSSGAGRGAAAEMDEMAERDDVSGLAGDESFRAYWREQGRSAYHAFVRERTEERSERSVD